jgi:hypothetical protein
VSQAAKEDSNMKTDPETVQQTFVFLPERDNIRIFKKLVFFSPVDHVGAFRAEVMLLQILLQCDPKQNKFFINKFLRDGKMHDCESIGIATNSRVSFVS